MKCFCLHEMIIPLLRKTEKNQNMIIVLLQYLLT